jgi:hypothetical protein
MQQIIEGFHIYNLKVWIFLSVVIYLIRKKTLIKYTIQKRLLLPSYIEKIKDKIVGKELIKFNLM